MSISTFESDKYRSKPGRSLSDKMAELVGPEIVALSDGGEKVKPTDYLNWVKANPDSESHTLFEWDDTEAAQQYRLYQARNIINSIEISIVDHRGDETFVKQWINVTIADPDDEEETQREYVSHQYAKDSPIISKQIVERAWREFVSWRQRYLEFRLALPLAAIYEATDDIADEVSE